MYIHINFVNIFLKNKLFITIALTILKTFDTKSIAGQEKILTLFPLTKDFTLKFPLILESAVPQIFEEKFGDS
jgi:hypothetical protein